MNIIYASIVSLSLFAEEYLQLVNQKNGFVVIEQKEGEVVLYDPILKAEMIEIGIAIPFLHQERYGLREYVKFDEPQFFEAFQEFYSVYIYDSATYQWKG
jgi:hypothetical protein